MTAVTVNPFAGQRPGTSGLRKKTREFMQPGYLEAFVQSAFNALRGSVSGDFSKSTLVVGGDGRYYNKEAIQKILHIAIGNEFGRVMVARGGLLSTPAMSAVIRRRKAFGGLVLSASHNPGGIEADFGIKYNVSNGGPAPEDVTERIYEFTQRINHYYWFTCNDIDIRQEGKQTYADTEVEIFDPLADYTVLMSELFDFDALREFFRGGFRMIFDGMHGSTGPYAAHILEQQLGAPKGTVLNGIPLEDFAGKHPDPNLVYAADLVRRMQASDAPDLGAANDADGDRNMILGRNVFISPGDSLAVIAEHAARYIPGYRNGLAGIARSMPTSTAADRVAKSLSIPIYETPTGWKYFGNLMDADLCTVCGEESFGTGSNHIREKDGFWAVLCWLSILCGTRKSVAEVMSAHWERFGRSYFQRHDYEGLDLSAATQMSEELRPSLPALTGKDFGASRIAAADDFTYTDPVDHSVTPRAGIRLALEDGSRVVCRLSGTGTQGATLRVYLERFSRQYDQDSSRMLAPLAGSVRQLLRLKERFHREDPDVIT
ncbi:MAG: alpha-D-glucose phosphate-specific phosphoglucomutase [Acidobacteriia bacterium]|nr:alpha-D-glucose phosphate-specific phosphoglucomutase [Terriglobia bacterium]